MSSYKEFAQELLFTKQIEQKILTPDNLTDDDLTTFAKLPLFPARPKQMQINRKQNQIKFPSDKNLYKDNNAGLVMHFFANHELLAIELMALVLLKFPQAEKKFREDIVKTIIEEQRHMKLYLDRMHDFGIAFGDIPASDMFWRSISTMKNPLDFVCRMSLTFEQANLDFCLYYKDIFLQFEDKKSASILNEVYSDEIGHVKSGYKWFQEWKDQELTEWDAYTSHLTFPLTPQRAKGKTFDIESRKKVGFSNDFINQFQLFSHSKGRTPDVFYFNPQAELEIAGIKVNKRLIDLQNDLAILLCFIVKKDDIILLEKKPSDSYLKYLQKLGIDLPQFVELNSIHDLKDRKLNRFIPWGWSPNLDKISNRIQSQLNQSYQNDPRFEWNDRKKYFFDKSIQIALLKQLITSFNDNRIIQIESIGTVCSSPDEIYSAINIISKLNYEDVIIKARFGAAGNQNIKQNLNKKLDLKRIETLLRNHKKVIVEPFLNKQIDFSFQFEVNKNHSIKFLGLTRFETDLNGKYLGHQLGKFDSLIDPETRQFLRFKNEFGISFIDSIQFKLIEILNELNFTKIHTGPFSIDALVYRNQRNELRLQPFLELNPRYTMGYLALKLQQYFPNKKAFSLISKKDIEKVGFEKFHEFFKKNLQMIPLTDYSISKHLVAAII